MNKVWFRQQSRAHSSTHRKWLWATHVNIYCCNIFTPEQGTSVYCFSQKLKVLGGWPKIVLYSNIELLNFRCRRFLQTRHIQRIKFLLKKKNVLRMTGWPTHLLKMFHMLRYFSKSYRKLKGKNRGRFF